MTPSTPRDDGYGTVPTQGRRQLAPVLWLSVLFVGGVLVEVSRGVRDGSGFSTEAIIFATVIPTIVGGVFLGIGLWSRAQYKITEQVAVTYPGAVVTQVALPVPFSQVLSTVRSLLPGELSTPPAFGSGIGSFALMADQWGLSFWLGPTAEIRCYLHVPWSFIEDVRPGNIAVGTRRSRGLVLHVRNGPESVEVPLLVHGHGWSRSGQPSAEQLRLLCADVVALQKAAPV